MKFKCNKKAMRAWIKALRSGGYKQCRGTLKDVSDGRATYCCLGVAARMYERETGNKLRWRMVWGWNGYGPGDVGCASQRSDISYLPGKVREWLGIGSKNPSLDYGISATDANDDRQWNFKQIADALEAKYL